MAEQKKYIISLQAFLQGDKMVVQGLKSIERHTGRVATAQKKATGYSAQLNKALKRVAVVVPVWMLFRSVIRGFTTLMQNSVKFLVAWEYQMAQIRIVAKGSKEDYDRLSASLLNLAAKYGASFKEIGAGAKLWAQQGKNAVEIGILMDTTMKASMLTGRSMSESVEDLTSVMKNYNIEAENSISIIDSVTNVMLKHAITAEVLIGAIRDVAPVANQFNISFEKMLGIITATHIATRAKGQRIGKAWRTIFSRMATTAREKIQSIAKVGMYLDEFGAITFEATKDIRNLGDALDEVAIVFDTLSPKQKAQLGYAMAGRRRLELLAAALNNYEEGIRAEMEAMTSWGATERAVQILLDTTEKKLKRVSASWNELVNNIANTEWVRSALDAMIESFEGLGEAIAFAKGEWVAFRQIRSLREEREAIRSTYQEEIGKGEDLLEIYKKLKEYRRIETELIAKGISAEDAKKAIEEVWDIWKEGLEQLGFPTEILEKGFDETVDHIKNNMDEIVESVRRAKIEEAFKLQTKEMQLRIKEIDITIKRLGAKKIKWMAGGVPLVSPEFFKLAKQVNVLQKERNKLIRDTSQRLKNQTEEIEKQIKAHRDIANQLVKQKGWTVVAEQVWKKKLKSIGKEKDLGKTTLEITREKLKYITEEATWYENLSSQMEENLRIEIEHLETVEHRKRMLEDLSVLKDTMIMQGYTDLQIEIQYLALLDEQGAGLEKIRQQKLKIGMEVLSSISKEKKAREDLLISYFKEKEPGKKREIWRKAELREMRPMALRIAFRENARDQRLILEMIGSLSREQQQGLLRTMETLAGMWPGDLKIEDVVRDMGLKLPMKEIDVFWVNWKNKGQEVIDEVFGELGEYGKKAEITGKPTWITPKDKPTTPKLAMPKIELINKFGNINLNIEGLEELPEKAGEALKRKLKEDREFWKDIFKWHREEI